MGMLLLIIVFTATYVHAISHGHVSSCGCLGRLGQYVPFTERPVFVLSRNGLLVVGLWAYVWRGRVRTPPRVTGERALGVASRGFTLIETLLVIALLAVLIALAVPHLGRVRDKARETKMVSMMRSHAMVIGQYATDYRGVFPYLTDPLATRSVIRRESLDIALECKYFDAAFRWHIGLADGYYNGALSMDLFGGRGPEARFSGTSSVVYPYSFMARPEYWDLTTRAREPQQFLSITEADVTFPNAKALTTEALGEIDPSAIPVGPCVGFVDCHARVVTASEATNTGPKPLDERLRFQTFGFPAFLHAPFLCTQAGARGRDVRQ